MIFCQACLTKNSPDAESCAKCGKKLMVLGHNQHWEEPQKLSRFSLEDHFLERISNIEDTVNNILDHLSRLTESFEAMDRNSFVTRAGLSSLVEIMRETNLLREEMLYQRWEATMLEQMEEARYRDRFAQMKRRFKALYRGPVEQKAKFADFIDNAEWMIYSERFDESAKTLQKAFKLDSANYELAYYLAEHFHQQGMIEQAIEYLELVLKTKPDHTDAILMLALLHFAEQRKELAETMLRRCLELDPENLIGMVSLASIFVADKKYEQAKPLLDRAITIEPQAQSLYLRGLIYKEEGRLKDAIALLSHATEEDPNHEDAVFTLGMTYLARGWTRKAQACFARAMELNPDKVEYQDASIEPSRKKEDKSNLDAESRETLEFAEKLIRDGKIRQAIPHYRQLLKKYPTDPELLSGYALLVFSRRRYRETLKITRKILSKDAPEMARFLAFSLEMESFRALNRYDDAIATLLEMHEAFPQGHGRVIANYGLAMTKADLGQDLKNAEKLAREALSMSPPEFRHRALDAVGWVCFKLGRFEEALQLLENALALQENMNHLYHYGMVLLALNLREEAFRVFERTIKLRKRQTGLEDALYTTMLEDFSNVGDLPEHSKTR